MKNWWIEWWIIFCGMVDQRKAFSLISSQHHCQEILTTLNLQHATSRTWICAEPEFRFCWMKLCSSDKHYTTKTRDNHYKILIKKNFFCQLSIFAQRHFCVFSHLNVTYSKIMGKTAQTRKSHSYPSNWKPYC